MVNFFKAMKNNFIMVVLSLKEFFLFWLGKSTHLQTQLEGEGHDPIADRLECSTSNINKLWLFVFRWVWHKTPKIGRKPPGYSCWWCIILINMASLHLHGRYQHNTSVAIYMKYPCYTSYNWCKI